MIQIFTLVKNSSNLGNIVVLKVRKKEPKMVIAVGACACSGGIFGKNYATTGGIDSIVPVDVFIPGCPPRPQALIYGIMMALNKI